LDAPRKKNVNATAIFIMGQSSLLRLVLGNRNGHYLPIPKISL
jgi:hypothetical protein